MLIAELLIGLVVLNVGKNNMSDLIETKVKDEYKEHQNYHQEYHSNCSSCWSENLVIRSSHEDMLKKYPALKNKMGSNYPCWYREE